MTDDESPPPRDVGRKVAIRRTVVFSLVGVVALIAAAAIWVGIRGLLLKNELEAMVPLAAQVQDAAVSRDVTALGDLVQQVREHAASADSLSGDPVWRFAELTPVLGPNLTAARVVSSNLHAMSDAASPLIDVLAAAQAKDQTGFDVDLMARLAEPVRESATAFAAADAAFAELDTARLLPPLAEGVQKLRTAAGSVAAPLTTIAPLVRSLPSILGSDGPRNVLVVFQNNAELRTAGGIAGSFVLLRADHGAVTLVDQADTSDFPGRSEPIVDVPDSTTELFGDAFPRFVQNASMTADFTLTAELVRAWWATRSDQAPDAVISLDVPALAALLRATGPLQLPQGELTADNFTQVMLQDIYLTLDRDQQTAFQQQVTAAAFSAAVAGDTDVFALMEAMAGPVEQGRISVWSAESDAQDLLASSVVGGEAARHTAAGKGAFAAYFNDATTGKMGPFLDAAMSVGRVECRADGLTDVVVGVTLTNTAAADAGTTLPWWVSGGGLEGVPPGDIAMNVSVAGPEGAFFGGVRDDDGLLPSTEVVDAGFPTSATTVTLRPGETKAVEFRFTLQLADDVVPSLLHTPLIAEPDITVSTPRCE